MKRNRIIKIKVPEQGITGGSNLSLTISGFSTQEQTLYEFLDSKETYRMSNVSSNLSLKAVLLVLKLHYQHLDHQNTETE